MTDINDNTVKNKEIKEECDGSKSDGHIGKSNINQNIFIQTQFKVYNNYKEYPLYPILAKKRLNFSKIICSNQKSKRSKIKKNSTKLKELILEEIKEESEIDTVDDGEKS